MTAQSRIPWRLLIFGVLATGFVLNWLTIQNYALGMGHLILALALTFISHDFRGRRRTFRVES